MSHSHHHHAGHHAHAAPSSYNRAFATAVILNFAISALQMGYAFKTHSMSLMADAMHNFGDVLGLLLAWGANRLMSRPADDRYSYGYKRISILAAISNALILVATSAIISVEALYKIWHSTPVHADIVMIVAIIGIVVNGGTALLFMRGAHDDLNIKGAFLHLLSDAFLSFGVVIAAGVIHYTHWYKIDPIVGLIIVLFILWNAWGLLRDSVELILDAVPHAADQAAITAYLKNIAGVTAVHDLHIWGMSTKEIALTAHLVMPERKLTDKDYAELNALLKSRYNIDHATIQVESGSEEHPCLQQETC